MSSNYSDEEMSDSQDRSEESSEDRQVAPRQVPSVSPADLAARLKMNLPTYVWMTTAWVSAVAPRLNANEGPGAGGDAGPSAADEVLSGAMGAPGYAPAPDPFYTSPPGGGGNAVAALLDDMSTRDRCMVKDVVFVEWLAFFPGDVPSVPCSQPNCPGRCRARRGLPTVAATVVHTDRTLHLVCREHVCNDCDTATSTWDPGVVAKLPPHVSASLRAFDLAVGGGSAAAALPEEPIATRLLVSLVAGTAMRMSWETAERVFAAPAKERHAELHRRWLLHEAAASGGTAQARAALLGVRHAFKVRGLPMGDEAMGGGGGGFGPPGAVLALPPPPTAPPLPRPLPAVPLTETRLAAQCTAAHSVLDKPLSDGELSLCRRIASLDSGAAAQERDVMTIRTHVYESLRRTAASRRAAAGAQNDADPSGRRKHTLLVEHADDPVAGRVFRVVGPAQGPAAAPSFLEGAHMDAMRLRVHSLRAQPGHADLPLVAMLGSAAAEAIDRIGPAGLQGPEGPLLTLLCTPQAAQAAGFTGPTILHAELIFVPFFSQTLERWWAGVADLRTQRIDAYDPRSGVASAARAAAEKEQRAVLQGLARMIAEAAFLHPDPERREALGRAREWQIMFPRMVLPQHAKDGQDAAAPDGAMVVLMAELVARGLWRRRPLALGGKWTSIVRDGDAARAVQGVLSRALLAAWEAALARGDALAAAAARDLDEPAPRRAGGAPIPTEPVEIELPAQAAAIFGARRAREDADREAAGGAPGSGDEDDGDDAGDEDDEEDELSGGTGVAASTLPHEAWPAFDDPAGYNGAVLSGDSLAARYVADFAQRRPYLIAHLSSTAVSPGGVMRCEFDPKVTKHQFVADDTLFRGLVTWINEDGEILLSVFSWAEGKNELKLSLEHLSKRHAAMARQVRAYYTGSLCCSRYGASQSVLEVFPDVGKVRLDLAELERLVLVRVNSLHPHHAEFKRRLRLALCEPDAGDHLALLRWLRGLPTDAEDDGDEYDSEDGAALQRAEELSRLRLQMHYPAGLPDGADPELEEVMGTPISIRRCRWRVRPVETERDPDTGAVVTLGCREMFEKLEEEFTTRVPSAEDADGAGEDADGAGEDASGDEGGGDGDGDEGDGEGGGGGASAPPPKKKRGRPAKKKTWGTLLRGSRKGNVGSRAALVRALEHLECVQDFASTAEVYRPHVGPDGAVEWRSLRSMKDIKEWHGMVRRVLASGRWATAVMQAKLVTLAAEWNDKRRGGAAAELHTPLAEVLQDINALKAAFGQEPPYPGLPSAPPRGVGRTEWFLENRKLWRGRDVHSVHPLPPVSKLIGDGPPTYENTTRRVDSDDSDAPSGAATPPRAPQPGRGRAAGRAGLAARPFTSAPVQREDDDVDDDPDADIAVNPNVELPFGGLGKGYARVADLYNLRIAGLRRTDPQAAAESDGEGADGGAAAEGEAGPSTAAPARPARVKVAGKRVMDSWLRAYIGSVVPENLVIDRHWREDPRGRREQALAAAVLECCAMRGDGMVPDTELARAFNAAVMTAKQGAGGARLAPFAKFTIKLPSSFATFRSSTRRLARMEMLRAEGFAAAVAEPRGSKAPAKGGGKRKAAAGDEDAAPKKKAKPGPKARKGDDGAGPSRPAGAASGSEGGPTDSDSSGGAHSGKLQAAGALSAMVGGEAARKRSYPAARRGRGRGGRKNVGTRPGRGDAGSGSESAPDDGAKRSLGRKGYCSRCMWCRKPVAKRDHSQCKTSERLMHPSIVGKSGKARLLAVRTRQEELKKQGASVGTSVPEGGGGGGGGDAGSE